MQYAGKPVQPVYKTGTFRKIQVEKSFVEEFKASKEVAIMWLSPFESLIMFYNGMSKHWIVAW